MKADRSETAYLEEIVARLWPGAAIQRRLWPMAGTGEHGRHGFVVLPHGGRPRLLVTRDRRLAAAQLRGYQTSATGRARAKGRLAAALARVGALGVLPPTWCIGPGADGQDIGAYLEEVLDRPVQVSVHVGPPRAVRKPVLQVLDPTTREVVAFAKVGVNDLTRQLVAREASNLTELEQRRLETIVAPLVMHHGEWRGMEVLVQSALRPATVKRPDQALLESGLLELSNLCGRSIGRLGDHPYTDKLRARIRALPSHSGGEVLARALDDVVAAAGDAPFRFGAWHGDLTPWNMAGDGNRLLIWDWEHFESPVPLGYDVLHHHVHSAVRAGTRPDVAMAGLSAKAATVSPAFQEADEARRLLGRLYAIDMATRYLADGEGERGTGLGAVGSWLGAALGTPLNDAETGAAPTSPSR
ncbi:MAG TPA: hypothetical protein VI452_04945 [Marmoricola sp.]